MSTNTGNSYSFAITVILSKQGPDLRDLRRPLEGVIFWDLRLNCTHFGSLLEEDSLTEEHPDSLKQILWGCFGLQMASEAKYDLTNGFLMANNTFIPISMCWFDCFCLLFELSKKKKIKKKKEPTDPRPASWKPQVKMYLRWSEP